MGALAVPVQYFFGFLHWVLIYMMPSHGLAASLFQLQQARAPQTKELLSRSKLTLLLRVEILKRNVRLSLCKRGCSSQAESISLFHTSGSLSHSFPLRTPMLYEESPTKAKLTSECWTSSESRAGRHAVMLTWPAHMAYADGPEGRTLTPYDSYTVTPRYSSVRCLAACRTDRRSNSARSGHSGAQQRIAAHSGA